jgi:glycosyltransferase involved in cell wall biosynthesis
MRQSVPAATLTRSMRILHISTRLILGGSQENTVLSCEGQARRGHDVHLAFGPIYGPEGSLLERVQSNKLITTHTVPHLIRALHPIADARCYDELKALIRKLNPDIVHTHSSKAGILGRAAAWNTTPRPTVIHTIHGSPFHAYQPKLLHALYVASERFAANRCHKIVSVADAMTRQYLAENIGRPDQYTTIRSGMEVEPYLTAAPGESRNEVRAELGLTPTDFVIGTVARLAELKGHDDLLTALAEDLKRNPTWKLLWVGDGWWRTRLLTKARALDLQVAELDKLPPQPVPSTSTSLLVTGLLPPSRIPAMIRAMDVLAHPSYREGLPRTVPQALLCGVCPVAYDIDGSGEVCREMQTGRLIKPGDTTQLRAAIEWCAVNPEQRNTLAAQGRRECATAYSAQTMVAALEKVYAERAQ